MIGPAMRNPVRPDQHLYAGSTYLDFTVYTQRGPLVLEYLAGLHGCILKGLEEYSKIYVVRFDLRLPDGAYARSNDFMERFMASLGRKLAAAQSRSGRDGTRTHDSRVRFFWCREVTREGCLHFHCAVILNGHAFAHIGNFDLRADNLYARIHEAWASAHRVPVQSVLGLIHFPDNPDYMVCRGDGRAFADVFYRLSYLTKVDTKDHGVRRHACGWSRC